ncbi:HD domain-containing protein [Bradyrhizobium erythrophlei]|uniref:HD domain-containing protein n=1 Tax=Bradyrhizobium erythrophlei TaxID=1437360 RepID=A0A1H4P384_9BRAD|nr:HD domain-containing protein [Bradyrhizobium erythrophlei]SEC01362.1 HD domain-containing protein [Bradyrhizobium erythrophlei]
MNLIEEAREFARKKHAQQKRSFTGEPYFVHLEEVAGIVARAGLSETAIAAAWLHDTVEDTDATLPEICAKFGSGVAVMVLDLTDTPPGSGLNRASRGEIDRRRLAAAGPETQCIKCADLISNTSTIVKHDPGFARQYLPEKRATLEILTRAPAPLLEQAWASLRAAEAELAGSGRNRTHVAVDMRARLLIAEAKHIDWSLAL